MSRSNLQVAYDSEVDILYISLRDMGNSYGTDDNDFVKFKDMDTEILTGYTVMNFRHYIENGDFFRYDFEEVSLKRLFELLIKKERCDWLKPFLQEIENEI